MHQEEFQELFEIAQDDPVEGLNVAVLEELLDIVVAVGY